MKKKLTVIIITAVAALASVGVLSAALFSKAMQPTSAEPVDYSQSLTLNNANKDTTLPAENDARAYYSEHGVHTYNVGDNEENQLEFYYGTLHSNGFVRLNKTNNTDELGNPSYFLKKKACNGITSISLKLDNGAVDIYTANEDGEFTFMYKIVDKKAHTLPINGNYFKVQNTRPSDNAVINYFTINYGCSQDTRYDIEYTMEKGNISTTVANPNSWRYWENGEDKVGASTFHNNAFLSYIENYDSTKDGIYYRYQPISDDALTTSYTVSFRIKLSVDGNVRYGGADHAVLADEWHEASASGTVKTTDTFMFKIQNIVVPEGGSVVVMVDNILITRTAVTPS